MKAFNPIINGESGISVRGKLNDILTALVSGSEGINALWRRILALLQYINAMNGGVGGFIKDTEFDPSELDPYRSIVLISLKSGTFTNLKDINGNPIVISSANPVTIFYRAPESDYWDYDTENISPLVDADTDSDYSKLEDAIEVVLEKNGDYLYPITKFSAVYNNSGENLDSVVSTMEGQIAVLAAGVAVSLTSSPSTIYKGEATNITLTGKMNDKGTPTLMRILDGETVLASGTTSPITYTDEVTISGNSKEYRVEGTVLGVTLNSTVAVNARYPIYYGFGSSASGVAVSANRYSPTTTAAHTYEKTASSSGKHFYILVPSDISALTKFTMGGAPFVMDSSTETIGGITYKVYRSGNTYNSGTKLTVVAS